MTLTFDLWQLLGSLIGAAIFVMSGYLSIAKWQVKQFEERQNTRFTAIENAVSKRDDDFTRLEREWMRFLAELPIQYVRREDYIRGQSVLEAKLDALYSEVKLAQLKGAKHE
jgi:hypothetical protein